MGYAVVVTNAMAKGAVVTGCSSGIGLTTALELHRRGYVVWAGVRRPESMAELQRLGRERLSDTRDPDRWRPVLLDVTLAEQVERIFREVGESAVPLHALVNNAGYGQFGALEDVTEEEFRNQWEVNVVGLWRATRAALPLMRPVGSRATIVNISSILGRAALPFGGPYAASKFAVEALSDSLRVEVALWGIRVVVVEPGPIETRFNETALAHLDFSRAPSSPYAPLYRVMEKYYMRKKRWGELPPEAVASVIVKAIESRRPRTRYLVTTPARLLAFARRVFPDRAIDFFLKRYLGITGRR